MICACGGECREHEVLGRDTGTAGRVVTCRACGRREFFPYREYSPADPEAILIDPRPGDLLI